MITFLIHRKYFEEDEAHTRANQSTAESSPRQFSDKSPNQLFYRFRQLRFFSAGVTKKNSLTKKKKKKKHSCSMSSESSCSFLFPFFTGVVSLLIIEVVVFLVVILIRYLRQQKQSTQSQLDIERLNLLNDSDNDTNDIELQAVDANPRGSQLPSSIQVADLQTGLIIDGPEFEKMWLESQATSSLVIPRTPLLEEAEVEDRFATEYKIYCKAAGCQNSLQRFYFYAQHKPSSVIFLVELIVDQTKYDRPLKATIRSHDERLIQLFSIYFENAMKTIFM